MPVEALAQPAKTFRIGFLSPGNPPPLSAGLAGVFYSTLGEHGYTVGKNLVIEARFGDGQLDRLPRLASELVSLKLNAIVSIGTPSALAAKEATKATPIVMVDVADPIATGLVKSLARPGGNITGVSNMSEEIYAKRLDLLSAVAPKIARIAFMFNGRNPAQLNSLSIVQALGQTLGKVIVPIDVGAIDEIEASFVLIARERAGALIIGNDAFLNANVAGISEHALRQRLPSISGRARGAEAGNLMSYSPDYLDMYRQAAGYVIKVLQGAKPEDLPIQRPSKFELVINMKTARVLGITIPQSVLARADRVIE